ncbi:MAG TPA: DUF3240 family protein, partial [Gammaproteobacteria bacterium]|nr:DUF3240 family protein [Gammaproteobacteria bacterium]
MADVTFATVVVTLNVAPVAEERVIDWLLGRAEVAGFTSVAVFGHGASHDDLSVAEQVTGRQRRVAIRFEIAAEALEPLLAALIAALEGTDVH